MSKITRILNYLDDLHVAVREVKKLTRKAGLMMSAASDLKQKVDELQSEVDAAQLRVASVEDGLNQAIADLKASADSNGSVSAADVEAAVTAIQVAIDDLKSTDAASVPVEPAPEPTPAPESPPVA